MNQQDYDQLYRKQPIIVGSDTVEKGQQKPVIVDGQSVAPLRIKVINSTAQEMYAKEMEMLDQGGADYSGNEQWRRVMAKCGRLRR